MARGTTMRLPFPNGNLRELVIDSGFVFRFIRLTAFYSFLPVKKLFEIPNPNTTILKGCPI